MVREIIRIVEPIKATMQQITHKIMITTPKKSKINTNRNNELLKE